MKLNDIVLHRTNADRLAGGQFEDIAVPTDNPNLVHVTVDDAGQFEDTTSNNPNLVHVTGLLLDLNSEPIPGSITVYPLTHTLHAVSLAHTAVDAAGRFAVSLPVTYMGKEVKVTAKAEGYVSTERHVKVSGSEAVTGGVLLKLERDDAVLGMPRLVFVMVSGVVGVLLVMLAAWCLSCRREDPSRRDYLFQPLDSEDKRPLCNDPEVAVCIEVSSQSVGRAAGDAGRLVPVLPDYLFQPLDSEDKRPLCNDPEVTGVGVLLVMLATWCLSCRREDPSRRDYLFQPLDSEDKRPLCTDPEVADIVRKPYFDEEEIPPSETDSEDDIVLLRNDREWRQAE
ncbi:hypothetical protein JYU34_011690 [Plutella xylostella]|uniref:Carboxypeptidase regulatory-like domain-containing protein n=1 Tax=Plutella xylostella TaxID=51655 RepID=A0ABQ7QEM4_PLUXY|nr:hypothetical protein JYU34_011690 [Plutella xylostella]